MTAKSQDQSITDETGNRKPVKKINKTKGCFERKINRIGKTIASSNKLTGINKLGIVAQALALSTLRVTQDDCKCEPTLSNQVTYKDPVTK